MKCKNCKWWMDISGINKVSSLLQLNCEHPKVGGGCYNDEERRGSDGLNSYQTITTGPEFGCIHWEKKE